MPECLNATALKGLLAGRTLLALSATGTEPTLDPFAHPATGNVMTLSEAVFNRVAVPAVAVVDGGSQSVFLDRVEAIRRVNGRGLCPSATQLLGLTCPPPRLQSPMERCSELLATYQGKLPPAFLQGFQTQLRELLSDEEELARERISPCLASLDGLLRFIVDNPRANHPSLSLSPSGEFIASWRPHARAKIALTFEGLKRGTWMASDRDTREREAGSYSRSTLTALAVRFRGWMSA